MRTYNKTKSQQNIPRRNSASEQNWNPINSSSMSTSDTGIVSLSKGNVYYDLNDNEGAKGTELYSKILVRDEYGNLVELLRSSDVEDTSALGSYVNNQTIRNLPNQRFGYIDGRPSNAGRPRNIKFTFEVDTNSQTSGSEELIGTDFPSPNTAWTVTGSSTPDPVFGNGVLLYNGNKINQSILNTETTYVLTYEVSANVGSSQLRYYNGNSYVNIDSSIGEHTLYFTTDTSIGLDRFYFNVSSGTSVTVLSASVKEVISDTNQFQLPLVANGTISMNVDWGDGASDVITTYNQAETLHTYAASGVYTIKIANEVRGWSFKNEGDKLKINDISNWGQFNITEHSSFFGCSNMDATATDSPIISTTNLKNTFYSCTSFNGQIGNWDVRKVTQMHFMFYYCSAFNQPLNNWNTNSLNNSNSMFRGCSNFNQNIDNWNMSSVTNMYGMFNDCIVFNQNIDSWDVSDSQSFVQMFMGCTLFNQPLNSWDISSSNNISMMFWNASSFNQPLSNWDTSSVTSMSYLFRYAINFNQDLGNWDISSTVSMTDILRGVTLGTSNYDSLLTGWLGSPTVGSELVDDGSFPLPNTEWGLAGGAEVTALGGRIYSSSGGVSQLDQNIGMVVGNKYKITLDVIATDGKKLSNPNGTNIYDTSTVGSKVFYITAAYSTLYFKRYTGITDVTIDNVSVKEVFNAPPLGLTPNFGGSKYKFYGDAETARNELINNYGWTITDGGGVLPADESFTFSVDTDSSTLGSEMVDNSDFSLGDNGDWAKTNATISNGLAEINIISGAYAYIYQSLTYTSGQKYKLTATLSGTAGKVMRFQDNSSNIGGLTSVNGAVTLTGATQNIEIFFESNSNSQGINVARNSASGDWQFTVTNVSVKKVISDTDQFQLPLISSGDINMVVHWGDTTTSNITSYNQAETLHTYPSAGTYTINIYREVKGWKFNNGGDKLKMRAISNWGGFNVTHHSSFFGCTSMTCTATTAPIISTTNLQNTFRDCHLFDGAVGNWDVRNVTDFYTMFFRCLVFNQPLNNWNTSSSTRTRYMFYYCSEFNQPINNWEMKYVEDMGHMFRSAANFDQNISQWDITSIIDNSTSSMGDFMTNVTLSTANYDELLIQWEDSGSVQEPELVSNGDFDEIGAEKILDGDFSEEGVELTTNGDFATNSDWNGVGSNGWSIDTDLQQLNAVSTTGYVYQGLGTVKGKSYKVVVDATLTSGGCKVKGFNATDVININIIGRNTYTGYFTETDSNPNLGFNTLGSQFTGSIHSISVKEVGQDWSISSVGGQFFNASGLSLNSSQIDTSGGGTVYSSCSQVGSFLEIGKTYKLVIEDLDITSGSIELKFGRSHNTTPPRPILTAADNGTYVDYFTAINQNDGFTINSNGGTVATLRSISVKEVGQDWKWTAAGADWSIGSSPLGGYQVNSAGLNSYNSLFQEISGLSTLGKTFSITFTVSNYVSGTLALGMGGYTTRNSPSSNGTHTVIVKATNPSSNSRVYLRSHLFNGSVDNVSVKEVLNSTPVGITTNFGSSRYTAEAIPARESLVNSYGWTIVDGGQSV